MGKSTYPDSEESPVTEHDVQQVVAAEIAPIQDQLGKIVELLGGGGIDDPDRSGFIQVVKSHGKTLDKMAKEVKKMNRTLYGDETKPDEDPGLVKDVTDAKRGMRTVAKIVLWILVPGTGLTAAQATGLLGQILGFGGS